ncbi:peptidase M24 [Coprinopsis cinerea okayama7|uniref:Peptidase M24 n=1 Tax=Coprinopsis cinerea (strain Okayama-7 / 130 / ATCC MYA-4618 / FGSC 9003) TaxID=240176 RepID=A8NGC5_COPC7|nr:peptidase M24 [Coprinopsis cinerea okayama7\|eukprot:XP_001833405.2 peptidase M24 [Coprinopsis cinerea okayama7\
MPSIFRLVLAPIASLLYFTLFAQSSHIQAPISLRYESHCSHISPIGQSEFETRQSTLASTLIQLGGAAYVTESSANSQYYGNFSVTDWKLSERPLLLIIRPIQTEDGSVRPQVAVVTPKFEHRRATLLPIPSYQGTEVQYIDWAEDEDPYRAAVEGIGLSSNATIFVDSNIRKFIADGLETAAPQARVLTAPLEITSLRERKSVHELEIMQCANEATVLAIRDVHRRVQFGMRESQVRSMMAQALAEVGLKNGGCLVLFGLAFPGSHIPARHLELWNIVRDVQKSALEVATAGTLTKVPDETAREELGKFGLDHYLTHRLGHGIGLDGHEPPYLRGNSGDVIQIGHTFSNEPGIYIEGEVGIRLEDCFYIDSRGLPVYLTTHTGGPQTSPWKP